MTAKEEAMVLLATAGEDKTREVLGVLRGGIRIGLQGEEWISTEDAMRCYRVSAKTLRRRVLAGRLNPVRRGFESRLPLHFPSSARLEIRRKADFPPRQMVAFNRNNGMLPAGGDENPLPPSGQ